jgi:peptidoglycan/xylan/chitin deacetylase (PgdA/CDA1 family)
MIGRRWPAAAMIGRRWPAAAAAALGWYALPALTSIGPLRTRYAPDLAGLGDPGHVALTFDDGPHPESTPRFLEALDRLGVRATFFLTGRWAARVPGLVAEIAAAGHELATHGYEHRCLLLRGPESTYDDLARAREVTVAATGVPVRWFRPPYGVLTGPTLTAVKRLGLTPVLWTVWGVDWAAGATPESVHRTVLAGLSGGGTVLLHDSDITSTPGSWRATLDALPRIVESVRERGLRLGPLSAHGLGPVRDRDHHHGEHSSHG